MKTTRFALPGQTNSAASDDVALLTYNAHQQSGETWSGREWSEVSQDTRKIPVTPNLLNYNYEFN